jgi:hypothetical protein
MCDARRKAAGSCLSGACRLIALRQSLFGGVLSSPLWIHPNRGRAKQGPVADGGLVRFLMIVKRVLVLGRVIFAKEFSLALFLLVGNFKADARLQWIGIDLTLLVGIVTFCLVCREAIKREFVLPQTLPLLVGFFLAFLPCFFFTRWYPYAEEKAIGFSP